MMKDKLMSAASAIYGCAVNLRGLLYQKDILKSRKLPCPVISVGNITAGGTGKTPMTIYLAKLLKKFGYMPAIISRGYRGKAEKHGGIVSDGNKILMNAEESGDEPFMMAQLLKDVPVLVGGNRFSSAMTAIRQFKSNVMILDDGFQHLRLRRDINLVLLDSRNPFGNGHLLPKGRLREPLSALHRADAFIFTRTSSDVFTNSLSLPDRPVFCAAHVPCIRENDIRNRRVFAFSGIADNDDFLQTVQCFGCDIAGFMGFPDHHPYSQKNLSDISESAKNAHAEVLVTTEKDHARMGDNIRALKPELAVIGVDISFGNNASAFEEFIHCRITQCT